MRMSLHSNYALVREHVYAINLETKHIILVYTRILKARCKQSRDPSASALMDAAL